MDKPPERKCDIWGMSDNELIYFLFAYLQENSNAMAIESFEEVLRRWADDITRKG